MNKNIDMKNAVLNKNDGSIAQSQSQSVNISEETKIVRREVKQAYDNFYNFFNSINDLLFVLDTQGNIIHMNKTACERLEYLEEELVGKSVLLIHPEGRREEAGATVAAMLAGTKDFCLIPVVSKNQVLIPVETRVTLGEWDGQPVIFGVTKDISNLKRSEEKFSKAFHSSPTIMAISKIEDGQYIEVNDTFLKILGYSKDEVVGHLSTELDLFVDKEQRARALQLFFENGYLRNFEILVKGKDGIIHNGIFSLEKLNFDFSETEGCLLTTMVDITEQKKLEKEVLELSYIDQLTELYNRKYFEKEIEKFDIESNLPLTIVMADVNGLKLINDTQGHSKGDMLIKKTAELLTTNFRKSDLIARLGGDEFVIVLPKTDEKEVDLILKNIDSLTSNEKIGLMNVSIAFGYEVKRIKQQKLSDVMKKSEDNMYKNKLFVCQSIRSKTIETILNTLYEKSKREEQHSYRVSKYCEKFGVALDWSAHDISELKSVGLLHDIGKTVIENNILNKDGILSEIEWEEIKRHPEIGYRLLNNVEYMAEQARYILYHHERWDGNGYPKGLYGTEIPYISRIITIVDSFDAMTSERPYKESISQDEAIEELIKNSGKQFDPILVDIFITRVLKR